jgi:amino acid transporter
MKEKAMETLDYQMMDSILVATLFIVFLFVLFGIYGLFKKNRDLEWRLSRMETMLAALSNTVSNITVSSGGHHTITIVKQDDQLQK